MFETAELGHRLAREAYEEQLPALRTALLQAQYDLRHTAAPFPVIVVLAGNDSAAVNHTLNRLHEWLDARYLEVATPGIPTDEERGRPPFWRYWRRLPPRGRLAFFVGGVTQELIRDRLEGKHTPDSAEFTVQCIRNLEQSLAADGALLLKFWFHLPRSRWEKRLDRAARGKEPSVAKEDRALYELFEKGRGVVEEVVRRTSRGRTPWHVVESSDDRYRNLTTAHLMLDAIGRQLRSSAERRAARSAEAPPRDLPDPVTILDKVDLAETLEYDRYRERLDRFQGRLAVRSRKARDKGVSSVIVFEGWDAGGKGGCIRRLTGAMDARNYRVTPIAAPTQEENRYHYLWRFWQKLPPAGCVAIFDRSWYGRVLVERVEGFAREEEWLRAYAEINDFEEQLHRHGMRVVKFFLHIDPDEQLRRFRARENVPWKQHKIDSEDYRNRGKWTAYELAVNEMIQRTSTEFAPWTIVPANDKRLARVQVLKTVCKRLGR